MLRHPPSSTRPDTPFPYSTVFRSMLGRTARPVFDGGQIDRFPSPARSEGIYRASSFTMSAAFSAIIRVGELVLPEVMVGITEASAMRRPARPWKRRRAPTTDRKSVG